MILSWILWISNLICVSKTWSVIKESISKWYKAKSHVTTAAIWTSFTAFLCTIVLAGPYFIKQTQMKGHKLNICNPLYTLAGYLFQGSRIGNH